MQIDNYQKLVPSYNRSKTKFMSIFNTVVGQAVDCASLMESIPEAFSPESAVGVQLDIIGDIIGVSRMLPFTPASGSRILDDDTYRMVIQGRIAKNHWDGCLGSLPSILSEVFKDYRFSIKDNQDMSINVTVTLNPDADSDYCMELLNAGLVFPVPSGIKVVYTISVPIPVGDVRMKTGAHESGTIIIN